MGLEKNMQMRIEQNELDKLFSNACLDLSLDWSRSTQGGALGFVAR